MRRHNNFWTNADVERLKALVSTGISANPAAVTLNRRKVSVQTKARLLGTPFPSSRAERKKLAQAAGTNHCHGP
jgi:hypothetical protein